MTRFRAINWVLGVATLAGLLGQTSPAQAQVTWTVDATSSWNTAANWNPQTVPNGQGVVVNFGKSISAARTITINPKVTAGILNFNDVNFFTSAGAYTIAATSPAVLQLDDGANPIQFNINGFTTSLQTVSAGLTFLSSADWQINNNGAGANGFSTLAISGALIGNNNNIVITGSSNTNLNSVIGTTFNSLTLNGPQTLALVGTNTFTGGITIQNGTISAGSLANLGAASNNITLAPTAGALAVLRTGSFTVAAGRTFTLIGPSYFEQIGTTTILQSPITGTGSLTKFGTGSLTVQSLADYAGPTVVNNGTFTVSTGAGIDGQVTNTPSFTVNTFPGSTTFGQLAVNESGAAANVQRLPAAAPVTLNSARLSYTGGSLANAQAFGDLNVNGYGWVSPTVGTSQVSQALTFGNLNRGDSRSVLYVSGPVAAGAAGATTVQMTFANGAALESQVVADPLGPVGGANTGIIPWLAASGSSGSTDPRTFATYSVANGGLTVLDFTATSPFFTNFAANADLGSAAHTNVNITGGTAYTVNSNVTLNSLALQSTVSITGSGVLTALQRRVRLVQHDDP
jgi:autotransporter-associated beta strand protein